VYSTPPFTLPNYVSLVGVGGSEAVILSASTTTAVLCTVNGTHRVEGLTLANANGVGGVGVNVGGTAGIPAIQDCVISNCTTGVKCDGASYQVGLRDVFLTTGTTGLLLNGNSALVFINNLRMQSFTIGLDVGSSGGNVQGTDFSVLDSGGFTTHLRVQSTSTHVDLMNSVFRADKMDVVAGATVHAVFGSEIPDDPAFTILSELQVGNEKRPHESSFGGGDSHTRGMACFTNTNGEVGTWANITTALKNVDATPATLFAGVGIGNCFYVGADYQFPGIKALVTTARVNGAVVLEYWNGAAWVEATHLSTDGNAPYAQYAQRVFLRASSEQIRFGERTAWATKSLNGTTKYWVRWRVTTALTTSPAVDQIKLHTHRTEINADGLIEYFGNAEPQRLITWHRKIEEELDGFVPQDVDVGVASGLTIKATRNRWQDGNKDGTVSFVTPLPGLDTSRPLVFEVGWFKEGAGAGNVELQLDVVRVNPGDVFNGALPYQRQLSQIIPVGGQAVGALIVTQFSFTLPNLESNGSVVIALYRDSTGGNLDDTYAGNGVQVFSRLYGTFWR